MARKANYQDDRWAPLNLDIDPTEFDFEVALSATTITPRNADPKSTSIYVQPFGQTAPCRIHLNSPEKSRSMSKQMCARTIDVLCPLDSEGKEIDCVDDCVQQLSFALRLYKPQKIWVTRLSRRNSPSVNKGVYEPYSLSAKETPRFRTFARRLLPFHADRALFRYAILPGDVDDEAREMFGTPRAEEKRVLSKAAHIMVAANLFERADSDDGLGRDLRLILFVTAAEALFGDNDKSELAYRLAVRMATLNGGSGEQRKEIFELIRRVYDTRSRLLHGSLYQKKGGLHSITLVDLFEIRKLIRGSLLYSIALNETAKTELLRSVDRSVFHDAEIHRLRFTANAFWGLENSADEHLYSSRWGS
jgi:Apea-like HEPN